MPVYKLSMKIIKKNIPSMAIYIVIFLAITLLFAGQSVDQAESSFSSRKINIAFLSEEDTPLINGFKEQLLNYANIVALEDNKDALQDALFFNQVRYILRVPKGFTESFMNGEPMDLIKTTVPASMSSAYIDVTIDQYFNTANVYITGIPGITQQELVSKVREDMQETVFLDFQVSETPKETNYFAMYYFNYLAYSLFAVIILGITNIMVVVNKSELKQRNNCAPVSNLRMNLEFLLGHLSFTFIAWAIMIIFFFLFSGGGTNKDQLLYYIINSLVFTLCAASISFFIGSLLKNQNAISAISNVVTLGPCFISGIFVPQEFLGETVLRIASFTPTYWFAKANGAIANMTQFTAANLEPVYTSMIIQIGFAIAFLAVSLVLSKRRKVSVA